MPPSRSEEFLRPYRDAVDRFGPGFEATLWGSRRAQQLRFDVMIDLAGLAGGSITDVGCGPGDFAGHLLERTVPFTSFLGIDALPEVVEVARERGYDRSRFEVRDVVGDEDAIEPADFVCLSGTLNTMDDETARRIVRRAFDVAHQAVVFNFLSDRAHPRWTERDLAPARRFDTVAWIDWALGLSSRVRFAQDYLDGHDATIVIEHDASA